MFQRGLSVIVLNVTFNNISVISWRSVYRSTRRNHRPVSSHWQFYHIMLYRVHLAWAGFELITLVVIGTDFIGKPLVINPNTIRSRPRRPIVPKKGLSCCYTIWGSYVDKILECHWTFITDYRKAYHIKLQVSS